MSSDRFAPAVEFCESAAMQYPEFAADFQEIGKYVNQKLWHQLTVKLLDFLSNSAAAAGAASVDGGSGSAAAAGGSDTVGSAIGAGRSATAGSVAGTMLVAELYDKVVLAVQSKLHALSAARMAVMVAESHIPRGSSISSSINSSHTTTTMGSTGKNNNNNNNNNTTTGTTTTNADPAAATAILENALETWKHDLEATVYLQSMHAQNPKQLIAEHKPILQDAVLDDCVHAAHYAMAARYYQDVGPASEYYASALQFLRYADAPDIHFAVSLALAALTAQDLYTPQLSLATQQKCVQSLQGHIEYGWLWDLLQAVSTGDFAAFRSCTTQYAEQIQNQPALVNASTILQEKLTLTALVLLVWQRDASERSLTFQELAEALETEQVEWVVMRALSTGLLEGSMDQCDQLVNITAVQPQALSAEQQQALAGKYETWATTVKETVSKIQSQTGALLA